jgi:hypothetical protein
MTLLQDIPGALNAALEALALGVDIAWPGLDYEPNPAAAFLVPALLPSTTDAVSIGIAGTDRYQGIYQVSVYTPLKGGEGAARALASTIADAFRKGLFSLNGHDVRCGVPHAGPVLTGPDWIHLPLSIPYRLTT